MRLTITYSKIKIGNLMLINNVTQQRELLSERPIRLPLTSSDDIKIWLVEKDYADTMYIFDYLD